MRILVVVPSMHGGGAEFVARTWAAWLADRGHQVHVHTVAEHSRPAELASNVVWHGSDRVSGHLATQRHLRATVRTVRPDIVLSLQMYANLHALASRFGQRGSRVPVVVSERNLVSIGLSAASRGHRRKVAVARRAYRRADHVAAISHAVAAEMVSSFGVAAERCTVVQNPAASKVTTIPDRLGSGEDVVRGDRRVVLVFPCRLVEQKRPLLAVEVAAELDRRGYDTSLLVFGTGPLEEAMREHARRRAVTAVFGGWQEHWFRSCPKGAVLLMPSVREGFGNTLVEAAAAGLRSVAFSGALGVSDAVVPGLTGTLTPSDSPEGLADGVEAEYGRSVEGVDEWLIRFGADASGTAVSELLERVRISAS